MKSEKEKRDKIIKQFNNESRFVRKFTGRLYKKKIQLVQGTFLFKYFCFSESSVIT
jgi:hypothetical protein